MKYNYMLQLGHNLYANSCGTIVQQVLVFFFHLIGTANES